MMGNASSASWPVLRVLMARRPKTAPEVIAERARAAERAKLRRQIEVVLGSVRWSSPPPGTSTSAAFRSWILSTVMLFLVWSWILW